MRLFLKSVLAGTLFLGAAVMTEAEKPKLAEKSAAKPRKNGEETGNPAAGEEKKKPRLSLPIPSGHDSKVLKIPMFDGEGKLDMTFNIGVATRLDEDHVKMADLHMETYAEDGSPAMSISLPTSVLNLNTRVISTTQHVRINRQDFEITGERMEFNTETKQGKLAGKVRMLIYNLENVAPTTAAAATYE